MPIIATCSDICHNLPQLKEPVDIVIFCGSFCRLFDKTLLTWNITNQSDYITEKVNPWLDSLPAPCKIIVAGKNDHIAEFYGNQLSHYVHAEYIQDDTINCKGLNIYGTPWMPPHMKSKDQADAFVCAQPIKYMKAIDKIPKFVHVLVTNMYPREADSSDLEADFALANKMDSLPSLQIHIHSGLADIEEDKYKPKKYVSMQSPPAENNEFAIIRI